MSPHGPLVYCKGLPTQLWKLCSWDITLASAYYDQITPGFTSVISSPDVFPPSSSL